MPAVTPRSLVLWYPDWPVSAWRLATDTPDGPAVVIEANQVISASAQARAVGVRMGQRRREAQSRCPELTVIPADPARDEHEFAPLLQLVEQAAPGVQVIRPGLVALRSRGPARYYGGEPQAAAALLAGSQELGVGDARAGVADECSPPSRRPAALIRSGWCRPEGRPVSWHRCRSPGWTIRSSPHCCPGWGSANWAISRP